MPDEIGQDGMRVGISGVALDGSYGFVPIVGHRGVAQLAIRTSGQAAHAATPDLGTNAVTRMAAALHALASSNDEPAGRLDRLFDDALLERATLAIGTTIAGGGVTRVGRDGGRAIVERSGINVAPDWCEATIDCRHPRPADGDLSTIQERIASTVVRLIEDTTGLKTPDLIVEVIGGDPLVGPVLRHGAAVSGFPPWVETAPGGTDATVMINEGSIRTLVEFGAAGGFAHEPHEFVERDQIAVGTLILARSIAEILGVRPRPG